MQEGTPSMYRNIPKAQHALNELEEAGVPHISVIADPTLGGTAISYGLRGDYMIVIEGSANIGFSGKRVVEQFQQRKVAADFQHESWLLRRGFVDEVVATDDLARRVAELLEHIAKGGRLSSLQRRKRRRWKPKEEVTLDGQPVQGARVLRPASAKPVKLISV
jgi:acetyl-CoA carboxylase beta subunit